MNPEQATSIEQLPKNRHGTDTRQRQHRISARVTHFEWVTVRTAARRKGISVGELVRTFVLAEVEDELQIVLDS